MSAGLHERGAPVPNPLDLVEDLLDANNWPFQRPSREELVAEVRGRWSGYRLFFGWVGELAAMQLSCLYDIRVPQAKRGEVYGLLALINPRLWLGHFDLAPDELVPVFRHALPLRGVGGASVEQLEDLVDIAVGECERFYPAFQFVLWG